MLIAICHILKEKVDLGADDCDVRDRDRKTRSGMRHLQKLGCRVVRIDEATFAEETAELARVAYEQEHGKPSSEEARASVA